MGYRFFISGRMNHVAGILDAGIVSLNTGFETWFADRMGGDRWRAIGKTKKLSPQKPPLAMAFTKLI